MTTDYKRTLLLFAIFIVAFLFRVGVLFHSEYPPSSDIGFHSSIINLILDEEELPLWNSYHMGGEPLVTPPGYHLFTSFIVFFTGIPLLVAQLLISAFFSSFAVFPAYLVSRKMWNSNGAGFFAAFFVTVSSLSIEMLGWGGYPNVISLTLIILIFYLFMKDRDHPHNFNLFTAALLFGSLIFTHLFSLFVLSPILILYISLLLVGKALNFRVTNILKAIRFFFISVALGTLFVSPWLLRVFSFYFGASSEGAFWGGLEENRNLILLNRSVDFRILVLIVAAFPTLFMLKASRKRYVDNESLLLFAWYLVPIVMTQAYIFGVFVDYSRFMYFIDFPGILMLSGALFHLFRYVQIAIKKLSTAKLNWVGEVASKIVFPAILLVVYVISSTMYASITPMKAMSVADWYTTIKKPEATAMDWIQQRTANSAVLVSDHLYGWWLSGVSQRSTLSAAGLEFLLYSHEVEVAKTAQFLLDTDYYIDNGLIQVREDGPYFARHNPIFAIEKKRGSSYSLFHFNDSETEISFQRKNVPPHARRGTMDLSDLNVIWDPRISTNEDSVVVAITRENDFLKVKKALQVHRGVRFAELLYEIETKDWKTSIEKVEFILHIKGDEVPLNQSMIGIYEPYEKACGHIIFKEQYPKVESNKTDMTSRFLYTTEEDSFVRIRILVGVFDAENMEYEEISEKFYELFRNPQQIVTDLPIIAWDYLETIKSHNISFIVCRDQEIYPKFSNDPNFQVVYNSVEAAIFEIIEYK